MFKPCKLKGHDAVTGRCPMKLESDILNTLSVMYIFKNLKF